MIQSIFSTSGVQKPTGDITDEDLVTQLKSLTKKRIQINETVNSLKKTMAVQENNNSKLITSIANFKSQIDNIEVNS